MTEIESPPRIADRLHHDIFTPQDVRTVREDARRIADDVVAPAAVAIANGDERVDGFPRSTFSALADRGLFQIPFDTDVGGAGLAHPTASTAIAVEELAYYSNSVAAIFDVHCILAGNAMDSGTQAQRQQWLRPIITGEIVGAFATSEPEASSDLSIASVSTTATETPSGWLLRGHKRWITNAVDADVFVVLARTGPNFSTFIVPAGLPGIRVGRPDLKLGNRGQVTADIEFDDVELGAESLLGEVGGGLKLALRLLTYGRIGIAAAGVGMAQAAFDHTAAHLSTRHAFGGPLATKQHWQFLMARRATEIECARTLYLKAALRADAGVEFPEPEGAMAKDMATGLAVEMARDAVQALGAMGFTRQRGADGLAGPVEAIYRDSKIGEIYEGANEIQRWLIARQIFGRDITG